MTSAVQCVTGIRGGGATRRSPAGALLRASSVVSAVALVLTGCGGGGADLEGRTYTSVESRGHDLVAGSTVTLTFEDGRVSANAGCNTMTGEASWEGDTLEVEGPLASTMMACEDALMAQDAWLSEFLASSPDLVVEGDELVLGDDAMGLTLTEKV